MLPAIVCQYKKSDEYRFSVIKKLDPSIDSEGTVYFYSSILKI